MLKPFPPKFDFSGLILRAALRKTSAPHHIPGMVFLPPSGPLEHRRRRLINSVHTLLLAGGSLLLLAVTAYVFGGLVGVILALVLGGFSITMVGRVSPRMVLQMYKARPLARHHFPEGVALVEELARRAGLPAVPELHVVPSRMLNAFAVGRPENSAIAITDALVRRLTLRELGGVLAHEMSHIVHGDVKVMAFADMVSRYTSIMSTVGIFTAFINLGSSAGGYGAPVPWLGVLVLIFAPTVGGLLQLALSRTREFDADLGAALLTRDPDGLAMALAKLERAQGRNWETLMLPGGRIPDPSILRTHPPTAERVARLMALKVADVTPPPPRPRATHPVRRRSSPVPRIGSRGHAHLSRAAAMLREDGGAPLVEPAEEAGPVRSQGFCDSDGHPRIRWRNGGVWW